MYKHPCKFVTSHSKITTLVCSMMDPDQVYTQGFMNQFSQNYQGCQTTSSQYFQPWVMPQMSFQPPQVSFQPSVYSYPNFTQFYGPPNPTHVDTPASTASSHESAQSLSEDSDMSDNSARGADNPEPINPDNCTIDSSDESMDSDTEKDLSLVYNDLICIHQIVLKVTKMPFAKEQSSLN